MNVDYLPLVKNAVKKFYSRDIELINKNLCERCLVHRIAVYLETSGELDGYFVDCEFNKAYYDDKVNNKVLSNVNGNYVDIIVHKRSNSLGENLLCFELKRAGNTRDTYKDRENLKILTGDEFMYKMGFYIILGKTYNTSKLEVYENGGLINSFTLT